ncbi:hypothetical protein FQA39_LY02432 [Lamprigera yunnana]|nr:hypothetical protein FQA39_LY02432 [Lamprigera yunnana]
MNFLTFLYFSVLWLSKILADVNYRLPTAIVPQHYTLQIFTDLSVDSFNFSGTVLIKVVCVERTNRIILHSKDLNIDENKIIVRDVENGHPLTTTNFSFNEKQDFFNISLETELLENHSYEVFIPFKGILDDNLDGYYRSSYIDSKENKTHWISVTQFEANSARKAFPCFDEPAMKAVFNISLGRTAQYTSISNMPLIKSEPLQSNPDWIIDYYEETLPVSTYLIAFIVSDFEYRESPPTKNNVTFKIFAKGGAINQVEFAKELGPRVLEYYENYFNISYPLPKQDMIAIPDFSAGAMENWGLITYRESHLLYDNLTTSEISKHSIANVISHELAHQWFGNLVTMKWWTDLWLNEGFATQMAAIATNALIPDWNSLEQETVYNMLSVFSLDALKSSHPISVPVENPQQISEIFDVISYKKGSFLLHMLIKFLGEDTFKEGVTHYLTKHRFGNAEQDDLWDALTKQAHKDNALQDELTVKDVMDTWTLQTGYPVVTVVRNYACNSAVLMQNKFLRDNIKLNSTKKSCWWIPITYIEETQLTVNSTRPKVWLSCPCGTDVLSKLPNKTEWILLNVNLSGLYRINYDEINWKLLSNTLNSHSYKNIPVLNRVQLIDDSAALAWTGKLSYFIHFGILDYLEREDSFLPWRAAINNIDNYVKLFQRTHIFGLLENFMKKLLMPIYQKVGDFQMPHEKNMLEAARFKTMIIVWSCDFKVGDCVAKANSLFQQWQENPAVNVIPKDIRGVIYCTVLKYGGTKEWNFLWDQYTKTDKPAEKQVILGSLSCTRQIWLLSRFLDWTLDHKSGLRKQDIPSILSSTASSDVGYYVVKHFLSQKFERVYTHLGSSSRRLSRVFTELAKQIVEENDFEDLKNFTITYKNYLKDAEQTVKQALEAAEIQVQWYKMHHSTIKKILESRKSV